MVRATGLHRQAARLLHRAPHPSLVLSPTVRSALTPASSAPVVALESTIITHGLPYPYNLDVAKELEQTIADQGAVPATVALLDGKPLVGLDEHQLERLARCAIDPANNHAIKASRRDIAHVLSKGNSTVGGTTVSGTMILADMAGIPIFATGGIGGVHRGAESTMDISADLTELGRTPVAVFCSGPKSILDIPRTLEVLETFGVAVSTFNASGEFPAFYTSSSGLYVPYAGSDSDAAASIFSNLQLGLQSGQVFGNPIPDEWESIGQKIQACVEQAVRESVEQGIDKKGKEVTPWLLKRLSELIPESKSSNRALVVNNAKKAARVAVELERIKNDVALAKDTHALGQPGQTIDQDSQGAAVLIFGAAAVDLTSQASVPATAATTYPGRVSLTLGGVARNVAEAATRVLASTSHQRAVKLVSPRGRDDFGAVLKSGMEAQGMRVDGLFEVAEVEDERIRTAVCSLLLDGAGDLVSGVADMDIGIQALFPPSYTSIDHFLTSQSPAIVAFDGNIGEQHATQLLEACSRQPAAPITVFEPTSLVKSTIVFSHLAAKVGEGVHASPVTFGTPNRAELDYMFEHAHKLGLVDTSNSKSARANVPSGVLPAETIEKAIAIVQAGLFSHLLVKAGSRGVVSVSMDAVKHHPIPAPSSPVQVVNTTGCGDSFAGGFIAALCHTLQQQPGTSVNSLSHPDLEKAVLAGQLAARNTLGSRLAVGPGMQHVLNQASLTAA
ncbi:hypothetical protein BCV70DRAFT_197250 [Testicularia cyperi]|uniref:Carbohydrate kinase PfkB domain-containing protein n=1 Tax=Testicularia cyperi TaxID=1882483 RepID=A0A317XXH1_9BASI|nr:hypothetical protein BCV70DRAFT_197250 [Testicularia cyperi]